jgi:hypothetical protein
VHGFSRIYSRARGFRARQTSYPCASLEPIDRISGRQDRAFRKRGIGARDFFFFAFVDRCERHGATISTNSAAATDAKSSRAGGGAEQDRYRSENGSELATLRDKHGKIISTLGEDDFALNENGRPQTINYFVRESDQPLRLGLLVDTSLSQRRVLQQERSASYGFLDHLLRPDKDLDFVIHFDHQVELLLEFTASRPAEDCTKSQRKRR